MPWAVGFHRFAVGPIQCDEDENRPIVRTCFSSFAAEFFSAGCGFVSGSGFEEGWVISPNKIAFDGSLFQPNFFGKSAGYPEVQNVCGLAHMKRGDADNHE